MNASRYRRAHLIPLEALTRRDLARAGAKATNLGHVLQAGLPVPPGLCITADAFTDWLNDHRLRHPLLARSLPAVADARLAALAADLREKLAALPLPPLLAEALTLALPDADARRWAVRSSATCEDLDTASCAGQHTTTLNVQGARALLEAIRQSWISLFSERAVLYRRQQGLNRAQVRMAVIVQRMVDAEIAGVAFTADPLTGNSHRILIEAVRGLGTRLVEGRATPDRCTVDKPTLRLLETDTPAGCLTGDLPVRVAKLAHDTEQAFGRPQDVEWVARGSELHVVQSRPITALPVHERGESDVWSNANAMEALPGLVTPMAWSLGTRLQEDFLLPLLRRLGADTQGRPLVGLIASRAYLNLRAANQLIASLSGRCPVDLARNFGGEAGVDPLVGSDSSTHARWQEHGRRCLRLLRVAAWLLPALPRQRKLIDRWTTCMRGPEVLCNPRNLPDHELAARPAHLLRRACGNPRDPVWAAAAWMGFGVVAATNGVYHLTRRWLGDADGSIANQLLRGAPGMSSANNGLALAHLAAWIRGCPRLRDTLMGAEDFASLAPVLSTTADGAEFLARWNAFLHLHGHQAQGGMDVAQPRWSEQPDLILGQLRTLVTLPRDADPLATRALRSAEQAALWGRCRRRLRNPARRWLLGTLLGWSRRALTQRENVKNEGVRMVAQIRAALLEVGCRLAERGILNRREDIFFLHLEEIAPALAGQPGLDPRAVVAARRAVHEHDAKLSPPPLVIGRYEPAGEPRPVPTPAPHLLQGIGVSPGVATGPARVIRHHEAAAPLLPGEILVAPYTDPGWTPFFLSAAGIVVEVGGLLSHGSIVAREYGLPAVVNVGPTVGIIHTGQTLRVHGSKGTVEILGNPTPPETPPAPPTSADFVLSVDSAAITKLHGFTP